MYSVATDTYIIKMFTSKSFLCILLLWIHCFTGDIHLMTVLRFHNAFCFTSDITMDNVFHCYGCTMNLVSVTL